MELWNYGIMELWNYGIRVKLLPIRIIGVLELWNYGQIRKSDVGKFGIRKLGI
jgi:hypothetical protein